jgi:hypothetical protein
MHNNAESSSLAQPKTKKKDKAGMFEGLHLFYKHNYIKGIFAISCLFMVRANPICCFSWVETTIHFLFVLWNFFISNLVLLFWLFLLLLLLLLLLLFISQKKFQPGGSDDCRFYIESIGT